MEVIESLTNHILIAMPTLADPNFFQSVVLICQHTEEGAMGIIINRPTDISLGEILVHLEVKESIGTNETDIELMNIPVFVGGPLQRERGFVIHEPHGKWESSAAISDSIEITSSRDILEAISIGKGPERKFVALGYAAWAPGQIEEEMIQNSWLSGPMEPSLIFEVSDDERWQAAAASIGVDLNLLSEYSGHA